MATQNFLEAYEQLAKLNSINEAVEDTGFGFEEVINTMRKYDRLPLIPFHWSLDDIHDDKTYSLINFYRRGYDITLWFNISEQNDNYVISYYATADGIEFNHEAKPYLVKRNSPEDCVNFIFGAVNEFEDLLDISKTSDGETYRRAIRKAGYKVRKIK